MASGCRQYHTRATSLIWTATIMLLLLAGVPPHSCTSGSGSGDSFIIPFPSSTVTPLTSVDRESSVSLQPSTSLSPPQPSTSLSPPQPSTSSQPDLLVPMSTIPEVVPESTSSSSLSQTPLPPSQTPLPPSQTPLPPSQTPLPPSRMPLPPSQTPLPPSQTPLPPSRTSAPLQTSVIPSTSPAPAISPSMSTLTPSPTMLRETTILASPSPTLLPPTIHPTSTDPTTLVGPACGFLQVLCDELGIEGLIGAAVALLLILALLFTVCCLCCCCCKRVGKNKRKARLDLATRGLSFENRGATNGVATTSYQHKEESSLLDLHHQYDLMSADPMHGGYHYNETALDMELDMNGGGPSQMQPSQASLANTEVFHKSTLPELSPMSYSLTANYPFPSENEGLYLNALPASTLSLRQPTMFGLSLQNEESKSNQGSKLSIHGSRPSIHESRDFRSSMHGSRPSIHDSRPSIHESRPSIYSSRGSSTGLQGSRHMLFSSGTSGDLMLKYGDKEVDEEANERDTLSLGNRVPSPTYGPSKSESMEVPTRDSSPLSRLPRDSSPLSRPLVMARSHQLGHGKKDFASLTCIVNQNASSITSSPEPQEVVEQRMKSPTHKPGRGKKDLTSLTALPESPTAVKGGGRQGTIPEEEEGSKGKEPKESSPGIKKGRSKTLSRLEKLTSLDYIRQSFRIKKKKVSFNVKTPETTPTPPKKNAKKASPGHGSNGTVPSSDSMTPERDREVEPPQRRISAASSDMFSPTDPRHHQPYTDHTMGGAIPMGGPGPGMGYAQLSQPNYYIPAQYAYPQLSQQYYPQLSQGYGNPYGTSPYHQVPLNDFRHGMREGPQRDGMREGPQRDVMATRYQEVVTPDYSDITSPDRENFRERHVHSPEPKQGSEYSYELRPHSPGSYDRNETPQGYKHQGQSPDKFLDSMEQASPDRKGGPHPDYMMRSPYHEPFLMGSPQRYGLPGYGAGPGHRGSAEYEGQRRRSGEQDPMYPLGSAGLGPMPEAALFNSISVDEPHQHYSLSHTHQPRMGRRYSGYSESSTTSDSAHPHPRMDRRYSGHSETSDSAHPQARMDRRYSGYSESSGTSDTRLPDAITTGKGRVSWSSEVKEYPVNDTS